METKEDIDIMEDAGENASEDLLKKIYAYAEQMLELAERMMNGEILMKKLKAELDEIQTNLLPATMDEANMTEFALKDGSKFKIRDILKASLPSKGAIDKAKGEDKDQLQDRLDRALTWLRANEAESIIKNLITADVGKDNELADKIAKFLVEEEAVYKREENVNANTLTSLIKEKIKAGVDIDFDLFGVFSGRQVKVTTPKK